MNPLSKSKVDDKFGPRGGGTLVVTQLMKGHGPNDRYIYGQKTSNYISDVWDKYYKIAYNKGWREANRVWERHKLLIDASDWNLDGFKKWKSDNSAEETTLDVNQYSEEELYEFYIEDMENGNNPLVHVSSNGGNVSFSDLKQGELYLHYQSCGQCDGCYYDNNLGLFYRVKNGNLLGIPIEDVDNMKLNYTIFQN